MERKRDLSERDERAEMIESKVKEEEKKWGKWVWISIDNGAAVIFVSSPKDKQRYFPLLYLLAVRE